MINELAIKILFPSLLTLPNILKKVENPQQLELRVGLRRCWGEGSWNDTFMRGMRQTILRHCSMRHLRQRKGREKADIKSPLLTVQASCDYIQTIEVSCLYFSIFLILIFFSLFKLFFGLLLQVYVDC